MRTTCPGASSGEDQAVDAQKLVEVRAVAGEPERDLPQPLVVDRQRARARDVQPVARLGVILSGKTVRSTSARASAPRSGKGMR